MELSEFIRETQFQVTWLVDGPTHEFNQKLYQRIGGFADLAERLEAERNEARMLARQYRAKARRMRRERDEALELLHQFTLGELGLTEAGALLYRLDFYEL